MQGIGAFRRRTRRAAKEHKELAHKDVTASRLSQDHNTGARLLDCGADADRVK